MVIAVDLGREQPGIGEQFKPFQRLEACFDFCAVCRGPLRVADHERSDHRIGIDVERQLKPPVIVEKDVGVDSQPASECRGADEARSEEHTSELQSLMRNSYAVFCLKKKQYDTTEE